MDIGEIKARIAELEQRKAERNAMRGYRDLASARGLRLPCSLRIHSSAVMIFH